MSTPSSPPLSAAQAALTALLGSLTGEPDLSGGEGAASGTTDAAPTVAALDGEGRAEILRLVELAGRGHSPSARALVNASDLVTSLALTAPSATPRSSLRSRILESPRVKAKTGDAARNVAPASGTVAPLLAPQDVLTAMHMALPEDQERLRLVDALGAAGGVGHEDVDAALRSLLERFAPFMDYEVVVVSVVRGGETHHRVHRGFPEAFGNVDVVPRATTYCTHCVSADAPLLVHDGASEAFFRQGFMVQKLGARAYLGIPIRVGDKSVPIGALCCIGTRPRTIDPAEVAFVEVFADEAQAIVTKNTKRLAAILTDPNAEGRSPVYREAWFKRILAGELERWRLLQASNDCTRDAPILVIRPKAGVPDETWSAFVAGMGGRPRVVGELADGRQAALVAGSSEGATLPALQALLPGAALSVASVALTSADAWIAAATTH